MRFFLFAVTLLVLFSSCSKPEALYNLQDESYSLVDTDSNRVDFPADYRGNISVVSFIYTHCPDVCPVITANLTNIQKELQDTSNVRFIEITFDPQRDTPSVLKQYKQLYQLNDQFTLLTGDTATVHALLENLDIVAEKALADSLEQSTGEYAMQHSNTIYLMDRQGRIRAEYPASLVPPEHVVEDLQKLR